MCRKQDTHKPDTNLRISSDVGISPISAPTRSGVVSRYVFGQNKCCSRNWCIVCPLLTANNTRKNIVEVGAANILCIDHSRLNYIKSYQLQKYFMYWYFNRGGHSALTTTTAAIDVLARNLKKYKTREMSVQFEAGKVSSPEYVEFASQGSEQIRRDDMLKTSTDSTAIG